MCPENCIPRSRWKREWLFSNCPGPIPRQMVIACLLLLISLGCTDEDPYRWLSVDQCDGIETPLQRCWNFGSSYYAVGREVDLRVRTTLFLNGESMPASLTVESSDPSVFSLEPRHSSKNGILNFRLRALQPGTSRIVVRDGNEVLKEYDMKAAFIADFQLRDSLNHERSQVEYTSSDEVLLLRGSSWSFKLIPLDDTGKSLSGPTKLSVVSSDLDAVVSDPFFYNPSDSEERYGVPEYWTHTPMTLWAMDEGESQLMVEDEHGGASPFIDLRVVGAGEIAELRSNFDLSHFFLDGPTQGYLAALPVNVDGKTILGGACTIEVLNGAEHIRLNPAVFNPCGASFYSLSNGSVEVLITHIESGHQLREEFDVTYEEPSRR